MRYGPLCVTAGVLAGLMLDGAWAVMFDGDTPPEQSSEPR